MPKVESEGRSIERQADEDLRRMPMRAGAALYDGAARVIHCRGLGTCGTCTVCIEGPVSPRAAVERWHLGFAPHQREAGLRLACPGRVEGGACDREIRGPPGPSWRARRRRRRGLVVGRASWCALRSS